MRPPLLPLVLLVVAPCDVAGEARAPAPPHNLPPWSPGAAPPVPGPVFSKAFNALLVLMAIGCVFLGMNLRDAVQRMQQSDIGEDNELLTRGGAGNAQWLAGIQKTQGRHKGHHSGELRPVPVPKAKKKDKSSRSKARSMDDDDDDDDVELQRMPKPKKKGGRR